MTTDIAIWSTVEAGLAVTAGSLACIRPLFRVVVHRLGWLTDVYQHHPSGPMPGPDAPIVTPSTVSSPKRAYCRDMYNMDLISCGVDEEEGRAGSRDGGTGSMTNLVGGIVKTSAFSIKVEERGAGAILARGESSTSAGLYRDSFQHKKPFYSG